MAALKKLKVTNQLKGDIEKSALKWYRGTVQKLVKGYTNIVVPRPSRMYIGLYPDPKYRKTLPYWDSAPLLLTLNISSKHLLGLNLHYIPPKMRERLLKLLDKHTIGKSEKERWKITYQIVKSLPPKLVEPCIKKYLIKRFRSRFIEVPYSDRNIIAALPFQKWKSDTQSVSATKVYSDSREKFTKKR